jgi:hypothetical protein
MRLLFDTLPHIDAICLRAFRAVPLPYLLYTCLEN